MVLYRTAYSFQLASTGICFYIFQSQITGLDSALCKEKQVKISGFYPFEIKFWESHILLLPVETNDLKVARQAFTWAMKFVLKLEWPFVNHRIQFV